MIVIVDSREQKPWKFPSYIRTEKAGMQTGDYSVKGYEDKIRLERKSIADLTNCLSDRELQRYCGQLARLKRYPFRCVVVEGTVDAILRGKYRSPLPPNKMLERLMDTCLRFRVPVFMADNAKNSAELGLQFLRSSVKQVELG